MHTHLFMHMQGAKVCDVSPPLLLLTLRLGIWPLPKAGRLLPVLGHGPDRFSTHITSVCEHTSDRRICSEKPPPR